MFERILFPTDFSAISGEAAEAIPKIPGVKEVHVLHIFDGKDYAAPSGTRRALGPDYTQAVEGRRQEAEQRVAEIADQLAAAGLTATYAVEEGKAAETIIDTAKTRNASAIVLGASGKGSFAKSILGSVADKVIQMANRPVVIIKPAREWSETRTEAYTGRFVSTVG